MFGKFFRILFGRSYSPKRLSRMLNGVEKDLGARNGAEFRQVREGRKSAEELNPRILKRARTLLLKRMQGRDPDKMR